MRHIWENNPFAPGSTKVCDKCKRCGLVRTRTIAGNESFVGGFQYCETKDERLNQQNKLAIQINRRLRFFAVPVLLLFFVSCCPSRNSAGEMWPTYDIYHRVLSGKTYTRVKQVQCPKNVKQ